MKYVQINAYSGGWANSVVFQKHLELLSQGHESWVFWARGNHEQNDHLIKIASYHEVVLDVLQTRLDGKPGFHSKGITRRLLNRLDLIDPDIVHLHVLLGYYINIEMLFNWLSNHRCKVIWTLHDCWAFTGHCIHFSYERCYQWKTHCGLSAPCPQPDSYPETFHHGMESWNYAKKKELFTMIPAERMEIITPSNWLANLVRDSFLSKYQVTVINNQVDKTVFHPMQSDFRDRYAIGKRFMILGVASKWSAHKGLDDLIKLSEELDSALFAIVVVGLDKKQIRQKPPKIIAFPRTNTMEELAEIYSAADVFFNPTKEDNYPTVNIEAEACGIPVITYDTGGCPETISMGLSQAVAGYDEAKHAILSIYSAKLFSGDSGVIQLDAVNNDHN